MIFSTLPDNTPIADKTSEKRLLPVNLDVSGRRCLVVGGGKVAGRKASTLVAHGAQVQIIASEIFPIDFWPEGVDLHCRQVRDEDIRDDLFLVIVATNDAETNSRIASLARKQGVLVQQVDAPDNSDFLFPATLRRGSLSVSFSTDGACPAFASWLRDQVENQYHAGHAAFCELARLLRRQAIASLPPNGRKQFLQKLVRVGLVELLHRGETEQAQSIAETLLAQAQAKANIGDNGQTPGKVYLVGAGPGDSDLITVKGARCLRLADVVFHDGIINSELLELCPPHAELINVAKRKGYAQRNQEEIIALLLKHARLGQQVVRLKGGDPMIFGRGGEEARAIKAAGIAFEIVPGVSCISAVPTYSGIPLTDREYASSFGVYSAHRQSGLALSDDEWKRIALGPDTLIFLMGKTCCTVVAQKLIEFGRPPSTPIALICDGTFPHQQILVSTLDNVGSLASAAEKSGPGLLCIGEAVRARPLMTWFGQEPSAIDLKE